MRAVIVSLSLLVGLCGCDETITPSTDASVDSPVVVDSPVAVDVALDAAEVRPGDATPPTDVATRDAAPVDATNACAAAGGTCVVAMRGGSTTPGFHFTCPAGTVTVDGQPSWLGPGTDLLFGGRITGGCPPGTAMFEPPLYGCCLPRDGGLGP